jgi:hypothetical protein
VDEGITQTDLWNTTTPWDLVNTPSWTVTGQSSITSGGTTANFRTNYTHVATVTYDRYKRTAKVDWHNVAPAPAPAPASLPVATPMSKEELDRYAAQKEAAPSAPLRK